MSETTVEELVDVIHDVAGEELRSVIHLHSDGRDVRFIRDDVQPVPEERVKRAFETLMFDLLGTKPDEDGFEHGGLICVTRHFENAVELPSP